MGGERGGVLGESTFRLSSVSSVILRGSIHGPRLEGQKFGICFLERLPIPSGASAVAFVIVDQDALDKDRDQLLPTARRLPLQVLP